MTEPAVSDGDAVIDISHVDRLTRTKQAAKPKPKPLAGDMPRRYRDHRRQKAKLYREHYEMVIEQFPPRHRLGHWQAGVAADLMLEYSTFRKSKKRNAKSARRKLVGLLFAIWRECRASSSPNAHTDDLAAELARLSESPS